MYIQHATHNPIYTHLSADIIHIQNLQLTPPLISSSRFTPRQLLHQQKPLLTRATPILSPFKGIRTLAGRPGPQSLQLGVQRALQGIDDFVAQDGEEFVGVAAAAGGQEEVLGCWVVGYYEVAFGAVSFVLFSIARMCVCLLSIDEGDGLTYPCTSKLESW